MLRIWIGFREVPLEPFVIVNLFTFPVYRIPYLLLPSTGIWCLSELSALGAAKLNGNLPWTNNLRQPHGQIGEIRNEGRHRKIKKSF